MGTAYGNADPSCEAADALDTVGGSGNYFNPFGNAYINPDGTPQTDLTTVNAPELYQYLLGRVTEDQVFEQDVFDAVISGSVSDVPGMALGVQRRIDSGNVLFDATMNSGNLDFVYGVSDWTAAFFGEVAYVLAKNIDINAAVRCEDFDELGVETIDPKLTVLWRATDDLTVRASRGSSFRVGSIQQLFGTVTTVHNMTDYDAGSAYKPSLTVGNDSLSPETTDMWNVGFSYVAGGAL